jgi:gas vesicle protein
MSRASSSDSPLLVGLLLGVIQGVLLGLLFAPKPGSETNQDVNRFVKTLPQQLSDDYPESLAVLKRARIKVENGINKVKRALDADKLAAAKQREEQAAVLVNGIEG